MNDDDKKLQIATFRFGIISEFVTGVHLAYGEKERLINEKMARTYDIPFSPRSAIARSTIEKWTVDYKKAGFRIEGLYPQIRTDKGQYRTFSNSLKLAISELKKEQPKLRAPALITCLRHKKLIGADEKINLSTLYRFLKTEELTTVNETAVDKRQFEALHPNEIWQSDVMHGPQVKLADNRCCKCYLIAIIDDHSRLIIHAEFYLNETRASFLDCLRQGILKRGLPQKLYIDNGSCFKALHLEQVTAQLGIGIKHSRPYTPQGRGKIERWFKYVRDNFIAVYNQRSSPDKLDLINHHFLEWVDEYNSRVHGTTKQTPYDRFQKNLECVRPAPARLLDYFRQIEFRRVKRDRTVQLMGIQFEAPVNLIDRQVELRFHPESLFEVEIFFQGKSYGMIAPVNPHVNSQIGRNWAPSKDALKLKQELTEQTTPTAAITGQLFQNKDEETL